MRPILIVEDEPAIADLIEMTLEPLGQPLIKAHTGNEAANLLESTLFDLILLDVMLPGVDGLHCPYGHAGHLFNGQSHGGGPGARAAAGRV